MSVDDDLHLAVGDDVEAVADVALSEELLPEASRTGRSTCARLSCVCCGSGANSSMPRSSSSSAQGRAPRPAGRAAAQEYREGRQERAGNQQRAADVDRRDEQRRGDRPDPDRRHPESLYGAEGAREHLLGHSALKERERRDVHQGVPESDEGKKEQRGRRLGEDPDERDGNPPQPDSEEEVRRQPAPDQCGRDHGADQAADPDRRVEEADTLLAEVEQAERDHDDQHVEHACNERLRGEQEHEHAQAALAVQRHEAGRELPEHPSRLSRGSGCASTRTRPMRMAERRNAAAAAPKTTSSPVAASSRPPIAGPPKMPRLSMVLEVTLAAVSSFGVLATEEGARPAPGARRSTRWPRALRGRRRGRAALHDDDRRRRREGRPGELGDDDHTLAAVSIAEQSRERRSDRRREKPHESDEPDGGGAAVPVREHRQRDAVRPVRQIEAAHAPSIRRILGSGRPGRRSAQSPRRARSALTRQASHDPLCFSNGRWKIPVPTAV